MSSVRNLKRATLFLVFLSLLLLLLISNTTLECDPRARDHHDQTDGPPWVWNQVQGGGDSGTAGQEEGRDQAIADVVLQFAKVQASRASVQSSCNQAHSNDSYPASMLAIGSLNLTTAADQLDQLTQAADSLPEVDCLVSTLVSPLHWTSRPTISAALRLLKSRGVDMVSLATERMYSGHDESVKATTQYLEAAGIHWVGLTFKENDVIILSGLRVGFLAFCAVYGECMESGNLPFSPIKYNSKVVAGAVSTLKVHGADVVVVLVRWGRGGSYYPEETALSTARHLASLGVTLVIGDHPLLQQNHAYFEDTLVIFSAGSFFRPSPHPQLCWKQREGGGVDYSVSDHCSVVHPSLRSSLLDSERHTAFYHIQLSRSSPALAEYVSVPLKQRGGVQLPELQGADMQWTRVCGGQDDHCLACQTL